MRLQIRNNFSKMGKNYITDVYFGLVMKTSYYQTKGNDINLLQRNGHNSKYFEELRQ